MKTLIALTLLFSFNAWSQSDAQEEAIILNQEMQFLQESAQNVTAVSKPLGEETDERISDTPRRREESLERSYFGDEEMDSVKTRTAAPKRRLIR